ncbi:MAG: phosphoribosylformylglycinamidine cyclo-ligase [Candidatus Cloacimonetes bacterium]|nr:phosphoribosylformylglycinamidine cyclo-ligase [Candidatus Cloacimonadota bacterium]MCF7812884.1 phosphoribosylformylglycinamidine cyclo-ligase [Candidatus Cloacimonadota bacterium]MCF7867096.1 phosphoribosylformylglycinamidine cyclo-ligase [Candidatus Cloacimonadota bacterium]MCF7882584.1 phosphoribosylformylglycinamidine cyclo-ligase [Candidatus Cloacimonadota bacterium]
MINYKKAGVDIKAGDAASKIAYAFAKSTFASRKGMIGEPLVEDGSFAGLIDMGDFYLVQGDDGVGTKMEIAEKIGKYDTMGFDLLAMVADDAVCLGAETISITNTLDTNKVDAKIVEELMSGLAKACQQQKIIIPGGEIAEVGKSVNGNVWNATAVGILEKDKVITGKDIKVGDKIIALQEKGFRSNGFSLVRYIIENKLGKDAYLQKSPFGISWGEALLEPSTIYSGQLLEILGRFGEERKIKIKGIAHITGGGIPGNFNRILKATGLGAYFDNLIEPSEMVKAIQKMGEVAEDEAYRTWNMGNGMMIVVSPQDTKKVLEHLQIKSQVVGEIIEEKQIIIESCGAYSQDLKFDI